MPNKTKSSLLWEQIRRETELPEKVAMIIDATELAINESVKDRCDIREAVNASRAESHAEIMELNKILKGNGEPSKSVIARLERIEENSSKSKASMEKALWIIVSAFLSNLAIALIRLIAGG